jgi:hypothetical protein
MKTNSFRCFVAALALAGGLLLTSSARAQITVINTPITSYGSILFNDTTSYNSFLLPGITSVNPYTSPWGGGNSVSQNLGLTTDPVTSDFAQGIITVSGSGNNYNIALTGVTLNQAAGNTGYADLIFQFSVEFQLGGGGLLSQPTLFPNFAVSGTVQNSGNFASVTGYINYYGTDYYGVYGLLDTVNYNDVYNTPGPFNGTAIGVPVNGTTPNLSPNTTLDLVGYLDFRVDPASINVETVPVPEPGSGLLLGFAGASGFLWRKVVVKRSRRS